MSFLKKLFSAGAGELVNSVGGVIDNLTTSKEEKLEAARKVKELISNFILCEANVLNVFLKKKDV